jgi:PAS domain S-box-containing protein
MIGDSNLYRLLFDSANEAMLVMQDGCFVAANESAQNLFCFKREELLGKSLLHFSPPTQPDGVDSADSLEAKIGASLAGKREEFEWLQQQPDGEPLYSRITLQRLPGDGAPLLQLSIHDISHWKEVEKTLEEQQILSAERAEIERRLQESAERRGRQVQIATRVAQEITAAPDLTILYEQVVILIKEQFGYYHTQLLRYDAAANAVVLVVGYGEVGKQMLAAGHRLPLGVGLVGTAAATGRSVLRANVAADANWRPNPLLPATKGEIAVPIMLREQVLGILDVQSDKEDSLDTEDQLLLEGLCGQIAAAIEGTRLRQEMADRLEDMHRLQRFFSQEGWQAHQSRLEHGLHGYLYDQAAVRPLTRETLPNTNNGHLDSSAPLVESGDQPATSGRSTITSPLAVRGAVIGALGIEYEEDRPLLPEDEALLESISVQVAEALESARLLEQTQKRAGELETVARVSTAASTILQVDKLLQTVVDLAQERFGLYHVSIFLYNSDDETLALAAGSGITGREIAAEQEPILLDAEHSLIARAAREGKPLIVNNVAEEPTFAAHPLLPDTRAEMVIPMILGEELLGVFDVEADSVNAFTTDDLRIQTTLATQVAVSVQNARLYAEQLATAEKLRELDRLKSEFLASMSHELRTPLNSIIGFADVLLEGIDGVLNERMEEDVRLILDSGRHLRELIGEILDMSKIEAGMMELRYEAINPQQLGREALASATTLSPGKQLDFVLEVAPELEPVYADRTRFMQVLLNMLSNAIKFTQKGSITLSMRMVEDGLYTAVTDTGIGIQAEDIPIVFEQFQQVDGSVTRVVGGTGLGMPISKKLVELHGGTMGVESSLGAGSTFWFIIPRGEPRAKTLESGLVKKPGTGPLGSRQRRK